MGVSRRGTTDVEGRATIPAYDGTAVAKIFYPLPAPIAAAADRQLARYVEFLEEENKILRSRLPSQYTRSLANISDRWSSGKAWDNAPAIRYSLGWHVHKKILADNEPPLTAC